MNMTTCWFLLGHGEIITRTRRQHPCVQFLISIYRKDGALLIYTRPCWIKNPHIEEITYITTLAGYVHWYLTGEKVLGIGDASGMFPIDPTEKNYRGDLMEKFDGLLQTYGLDKNISSLLPEVLIAGDEAGC